MKLPGLLSTLFCCALVSTAALAEGISWPADQYLPSFSPPADTLDFMVKNNTADAWLMFTTLKGLVNKKQPRIYSYTGGEEGQLNWLTSLDLKYRAVSDNWNLLTKYRGEIAGIVVYDTAVIDARNLATTVAAMRGGIAAAGWLVERLTAAPYHFPILADFRGRFTTKASVYEYLHANYWPELDHRLLVCLNPRAHYGFMRDHASATGAAIVWLDPRNEAEKLLLDRFLQDMPGGSGVTMGWWPDEAAGIREASRYGLATCASDFSENLTVFSGMPRNVTVKQLPPKPPLENKIYVTLILSDGDNLQYVEHRMKKMWDLPARGSIPLSWTISPAMLDAMPAVMDYYYRTATDNDCFIAGPSGVGYTYPNFWTELAYLDRFVQISDEYLKRSGLRVVTIWNTITGGLSDTTGRAFADHAPSLLGITGMKAGGAITVYNGVLPAQELNATYCYSQESLIYEIDKGIQGWAGARPRFVSIQANPWQSSYADLVNAVAHYQTNADVVFVRADHYFQLIRESKGLPYEISATPVLTRGSGAIRQPALRFNQAAATIRIAGDPQAGTLALYSAQGSCVLTSRGHSTVSLQALPAGSYLAVFRQGQVRQTLRCVLLR